MDIKPSLDLLGLKVRDKVTNYIGIVTSVSFDLYGCIQVIINPGVGDDGKMKDSLWFDLNRIEVLEHKPVMAVPDFTYGKGPEAKSILKS